MSDSRLALAVARERARLLEQIVGIEDVITEYLSYGATGTPHDLEHRTMLAGLRAELEALP